eukprot:2419684-Pyramimonas_sp.AAC.1
MSMFGRIGWFPCRIVWAPSGAATLQLLSTFCQKAIDQIPSDERRVARAKFFADGFAKQPL